MIPHPKLQDRLDVLKIYSHALLQQMVIPNLILVGRTKDIMVMYLVLQYA